MVNNKKGSGASGMVLFVATVLIILILLIFFIGSSVVKEWDGKKAGLRVYGSLKGDRGNTDSYNGLGNIGEYIETKKNFLKVRKLVNEGKSIRVSVLEAGYGK